MKLSQLPPSQRPREKLIQQGPDALTDAELLAIFLRTGTKQQSAIELADQILHHFGSLGKLLNAPLEQFEKINGIGVAKYTLLTAVQALAFRYYHEQLSESQQITHSRDVLPIIKSQLAGQRNECFFVVLLGTQRQIIATELISQGDLEALTINQRDLFYYGLKHNAKYMMIAHNHPTGIAQPSTADIEATKQLKNNLEIINITLLDHIIVSLQDHFIFSEYQLVF